ncbi:NAD-dependent nucleoside-diphosphate-sugar epimerase protein (plasmid) [Rhizobium sp. CIAT894]|uniref:NmrA family NAD(P)-binding protein n=1 Tax=Rhizobium sp. CIAT894 TaxID=2020312 RepID=UPI000A1D670B|nr:NmrA family NAD(P)-binding protein [Rhizobium sp. CIAT894]ARM92415.1 NAD-dependent nucleoside-diphosphate-sugar epimerase protein [Rhizobium sp. CIAT894]
MITITAATGRYGRLVIDALLKRGVPAHEVVAAVRDPGKASDLAAKGLKVREADYDRPETLASAFAGADKILLVPSADFGRRYSQMQRAVNAAVEAQVGLIAYAGFVNGETSTLLLGDEHKQTEEAITATGLPHIFLRNGAYIEVYAGDLGDIGYALTAGELMGAAANGYVSGASRADLAEAAAVVLSSEAEGNAVYELAGTSFTMTDMAATISKLTGKPLVYQDMPVEQYRQVLATFMPGFLAEIVADASFATQRGDWFSESTDLERLLGRPTTPLAEVVSVTLKRNGLI